MMYLLAICTSSVLLSLVVGQSFNPPNFSLPPQPQLIVNTLLVDSQIHFSGSGEHLEQLPVQTFVRQGTKTFLAALDGWIYIIEFGVITPLASISASGNCVQGQVINLVQCGQPTGMVMGPDGVTLHIADSFIGYITVHSVTGARTLVLPMGTLVEGVQTKFFEDVTVDNNGVVYLAEASTKWGQADLWTLVLEAGAHGRVIKLKKNGETSVVVDGIAYCSSVQLAPDGVSLLISELSRARVLRHYIKGPETGSTVIFAENLPGFPDNIRPSSGGGWWCGSPLVRDQHILDVIATLPAFRFIMRDELTDDEIAALYQVRGMLFELSASGEVIRVLQDLTAQKIGITTEVNDDGDSLLIGHYALPGAAEYTL